MALAVSVRFDFRDSKGKTSFTKIRVPNGFALSDYLEFAQAAAQTFANASVAIVTRASVCVGIDLSGVTLKLVAAATADIAQKAFFQFNTALAGFRSKMRIPTLDETKVPVGSDAIDQADPAVAAFTTAMTNGVAVTLGTISPSDDRENDITGVGFAREVFRGT